MNNDLNIYNNIYTQLCSLIRFYYCSGFNILSWKRFCPLCLKLNWIIRASPSHDTTVFYVKQDCSDDCFVLSGACGCSRLYNTLRKERMLLFYCWGKRIVLYYALVLLLLYFHHLNNNLLTWCFEQISCPYDVTSLSKFGDFFEIFFLRTILWTILSILVLCPGFA